MRIFFFLALAGLLLSTAAHVSTFMGIDPQESFPYIWLLHIGIFVVWLPAVAVQLSIPRDENGKFKPFAFAPKWMQLLTKAAFTYALVNIVLFSFLTSSGTPSQENGRYVLHSHGRVIRQITEQEYHQYRAYTVRGFSGHWMVFYLAAMTILASATAHRRTATHSALSAPILEDGRKRMPLWIHTIFAVLIQAVGFFLGPAIFMLALFKLHLNIGCCGSVLWLATPWPGLVIALYLLKHKLPGVCPSCGGRAFWTESKGAHYRCADCGWTGG